MLRQLATQIPGESAGFDAQLLLAEITGHSRAWLFSHPEFELNPEQQQAISSALKLLQDGMPLPYVLGHWEFFGLDFLVTPDVLIPRPETELLVETALAHVRAQPTLGYRMLDVGTGSGIIPISLAVHVPQASLVATDISPAALQVALQNAERHGVSERIHFEQADLLPDKFGEVSYDIICANLPYIPTETLPELEVFGREPTLALDGGADGLDLIRNLLQHLASASLTECLILLEIEQRQGASASALALESFPRATVRVKRDLAGFDRLVMINT